MKVISLIGVVILLCASTSAFTKSSSHCYVSGDISDSMANHPSGSQQNPYNSLAEVQADLDCEVINVLYSDVVLDGGILLKDGQRLEGKKGPGGALPVITNSSSTSNFGVGVFLARNNRLKHLHVADTWRSGVIGAFVAQPTGGDIVIQSVLITGANQSNAYTPPGTIHSGFLIFAEDDMKLTIRNSEIGEADVPSINILQYSGHADIMISNTSIHDQGHVPDGANEESPGISVNAYGASSVDVAVLNTSVSNIGHDEVSNSDGLLLIHNGSGVMNAKVDGYRYSNPDGGGAVYTSTGIEMGCLHVTAVGCTFRGTVTNSAIHDAYLSGIQVVDFGGAGGDGSHNTVIADIRDNEISGSLFGIYLGADNEHGTRQVRIVDNTISNSAIFGILIATYRSDAAEVYIEGNTILHSGDTGLLFEGDSASVTQLDAGLGGLGSAGNNRIINSAVNDILSWGVPVSAAHNWWGSDTGPTSVVEENGGTVDVDPYLTTDPNP